MAGNGSIANKLKAVSLFDMNDFDNTETREQLATLFHEIIMSNDPTAKSFFKRFKLGVDKVIKDMGIIDSVPDQKDDMGSEVDGDANTVVNDKGDEVNMNPSSDEEQDAKSASDMLGDSYNPMIELANRYLV